MFKVQSAFTYSLICLGLGKFSSTPSGHKGRARTRYKGRTIGRPIEKDKFIHAYIKNITVFITFRPVLTQLITSVFECVHLFRTFRYNNFFNNFLLRRRENDTLCLIFFFSPQLDATVIFPSREYLWQKLDDSTQYKSSLHHVQFFFLFSVHLPSIFVAPVIATRNLILLLRDTFLSVIATFPLDSHSQLPSAEIHQSQLYLKHPHSLHNTT